MSQSTLWLGIAMMVVMAALVTPRVVRLNRGRALRNAAVWVAIVLLLVAFYQLFGPFGGPSGAEMPARQESNPLDRPAPAPGSRPNLKDDSAPL